MKSRVALAGGALMALVALGGAQAQAQAQAQALQPQSHKDEPAAPSQLPASQAKAKGASDQNMPVDTNKVGTQPAAPSPAPAPQATTQSVKQKP